MTKQISPTVSIDEVRDLYILHTKEGTTCLSFEVVESRSERYIDWLSKFGVQVKNDFESGTASFYFQYKNIVELVKKVCTERKIRCDCELTPQLVGLEGKRVEVTDCYGERRRFQVGKSTGFIPIHLELHNKSSKGGPAVYGAPFQEVEIIWRNS
jgi:hypothetical protein